MGKSSQHTILLDCGTETRKVCKLIFGSDGSYYVTAPYHSVEKAMLFKAEVDYNTSSQLIAMDQTIDLSTLDEGRLKLSHHASGFVQYSGDGVLSGLDENGTPKGMGLFADKLENVGSGPAFGMGIKGIDCLATTKKNSKHDILIRENEITPLTESNGIMLEGHYFQPRYRRFVFTEPDGGRYIIVPHPNGMNIKMRVVLAPFECDYPGLIGLEIYRAKLGFPDDGFTLNGPGQMLPPRTQGERKGILLFCSTHKPPNLEDAKSLDYPKPPT